VCSDDFKSDLTNKEVNHDNDKTHEADKMNLEVDSRDEVMHIKISDTCDFH